MKTHRTCGECINCVPFEQRKLLCAKNESGIEVDSNYCCKDFKPKKEVIINKLEAAAKKCAKTGSRYDLQQYLKLRREML